MVHSILLLFVSVTVTLAVATLALGAIALSRAESVCDCIGKCVNVNVHLGCAVPSSAKEAFNQRARGRLRSLDQRRHSDADYDVFKERPLSFASRAQ